MIKIHKKNGFTLLECIIAISLFGLLLSITSQILISFYKNFNFAIRKNQICEVKNYLNNRLSYNLRNAIQILPESNYCTLAFIPNSNSRKPIKYSLINNKIRERIGKSSHYLTEEKIIKNLEFLYKSSFLICYKITFIDNSILSKNIFIRNN